MDNASKERLAKMSNILREKGRESGTDPILIEITLMLAKRMAEALANISEGARFFENTPPQFLDWAYNRMEDVLEQMEGDKSVNRGIMLALTILGEKKNKRDKEDG